VQPGVTAPAAPASASIRALDGDRFEVTWTPGSNNHTGFRIKGTGGTTLRTIDQATARTATLPNPNPGQRMCVNVFAFNSAGESPARYANCAEPLPQVPAAPSNVRVGVFYCPAVVGWECDDLGVSWNDNSTNEAGFRVYANGILVWSGPANSTEAAVTVLHLNYNQFCFTVAAFNAAGESPRVGGSGSACWTKPPVQATFALEARVLPTSTLQVGQNFQICYHLTPEGTPHTIRVTRSINGGPFEFNAQVNDDGYHGDCLPGTVQGAAGTRTYRVEAIINGSVVAHTQFNVTVGGGNTQPPGGGGNPGGTCDRAPSSPTNFQLSGNVLTWQVADPGGSGCNLTYRVLTFGGQQIYQGSTPSATLPTTSCNSGYFVGAANQAAGFNFYSLWQCPNQ